MICVCCPCCEDPILSLCVETCIFLTEFVVFSLICASWTDHFSPSSLLLLSIVSLLLLSVVSPCSLFLLPFFSSSCLLLSFLFPSILCLLSLFSAYCLFILPFLSSSCLFLLSLCWSPRKTNSHRRMEQRAKATSEQGRKLARTIHSQLRQISSSHDGFVENLDRIGELTAGEKKEASNRR